MVFWSPQNAAIIATCGVYGEQQSVDAGERASERAIGRASERKLAPSESALAHNAGCRYCPATNVLIKFIGRAECTANVNGFRGTGGLAVGSERQQMSTRDGSRWQLLPRFNNALKLDWNDITERYTAAVDHLVSASNRCRASSESGSDFLREIQPPRPFSLSLPLQLPEAGARCFVSRLCAISPRARSDFRVARPYINRTTGTVRRDEASSRGGLSLASSVLLIYRSLGRPIRRGFVD